MRKELRQMHVAVNGLRRRQARSIKDAYADYKKTYGGMYDTLDNA